LNSRLFARMTDRIPEFWYIREKPDIENGKQMHAGWNPSGVNQFAQPPLDKSHHSG
jgi:hypothetical protein